ncbi:hypothetical protein Ancab_011097 [Ancistrocladus abbreviatus]
MARNNKYTSINFNDVYEKVINNTISASSAEHPNSSSPWASSSVAHHNIASPTKSYSLSASRSHGGMLVLSRPSPKPLSQCSSSSPVKAVQEPRQFQPPKQQLLSSSSSDQARFEPDTISLRPLGKTGSGHSPSLSSLGRETEGPPPSVMPKSDKFIPPHLRPGFVAKQQRPVPEFRMAGNCGSPVRRYEEDRRPKSGGGYERNRRSEGESDLSDMNQHRFGGSRPSSSG